MFSFVATIPPGDLSLNKPNLTIGDNSLLMADPEDPTKELNHYHFSLICTDFADYCKHWKKDKDYIFLTIHTKDFPITPNIVTSNFTKFANMYLTKNQEAKISLQVGSAQPVVFENSRDAAAAVKQYASKPQILVNSVAVIRITSKPLFTWFIVPYTTNVDNSPQSQFLSALKGTPNSESEEHKLYRSLLSQGTNIVVNFQFTLNTDNFKFIETYLKLIETLGGVPSKPRTPTKNSKMSPSKKEEIIAPKPIQWNNWDWRKFVEVIPATKRGKGKKNDKQRLVYVAQKAAAAPDVTSETMDEILNELDKEIIDSTQYYQDANKRIEDLDFEYEAMVADKAKCTKEFEAKKKEYHLIHKANSNREVVKKDEKIGFDDDIDFTIGVLRNEIEATQKEIEYLKSAFEDLDNIGEEEEEEAEELSETDEEIKGIAEEQEEEEEYDE